MQPFIRILGETTNRSPEVGDVVPWRLSTHVVTPEGLTRSLVRQVEIDDERGERVFAAPPLIIGPRPPDLERFDRQGQAMDCEYEPVLELDRLDRGSYMVRARLETDDGDVVAESCLPIRPEPPPRLQSRIRLAWAPSEDPFERLYTGGIVRAGDIDGDGRVEIVHAVGARHVCVYRLDGEVVWRYDDPDGAIIYNTAPFRVHDIDGDGCAEIFCCRGPFGDLKLAMLDGATGDVRRDIPFPLMAETEVAARPHLETLKQDPKSEQGWAGMWQTGYTVRFAFDPESGTRFGLYGAKIIVSDFRGRGLRDLLVQVGDQNCTSLVALDEHLDELWRHRVDDGYGGHTPAAADLDGDGRDEIAVGTRLLDHDGTLLWRKPFDQFAAPWEDDHIDQAHAGPFGPDGAPVIVYSCRVCVDPATGETRWIEPTWHGQEAHVARMLPGDAYQAVFSEREYRHSGHLCHGTWFDCRDAEGRPLWSYRHAALHMHRMLDWNGDGLYEASFGLDLQRRPVRPNLGIFDGEGQLTCVLPRYGFGADVDGDGFDELVSWTQWPDVADTIEIYGMDRAAMERGRAVPASLNPFSYNEPD
ncbi:MAG: hypothetical protein CMJ18_19450 [Phycisphaeraceae bacterium]|nr:hypothetical protein [Phycisphaeraceae bacterium]